MDYNQAGQRNIYDEDFFTSGSGVDFQAEKTRPEYNLNSDQNSWESSYRNQGNKALNVSLEKMQPPFEQALGNEAYDLTSRSIELTMPPVAEQIVSTEQSIEDVAPENELSIIKTKEKLSKGAIEIIEKKNRAFYDNKISPEQFYSDTRRLMLANLDNSYDRKIAA